METTGIRGIIEGFHEGGSRGTHDMMASEDDFDHAVPFQGGLG